MDKTEPTIKVLHLIDSGGLYGAEKMLLTLCSEQIKQGLQPTILSCGTVNEEPKAIELEAERLGIPSKAWRMKAGLNVKGMREIWRWVHEQGFTHLHSHGYKFNILLALTKKRAFHVKLISTVHGYTVSKPISKGWFYKWTDKLLLSRFDAIVYVNDFVGVSALFKAIYRTKLIFISNGIDLNKSASNNSIAERDFSKTISKFLIVGRLSPEKGHVFALHALSDLLANTDNKIPYSLTIAGEGPLREELEKNVSELGLNEAVNFLGFVSDIDSIYKEYDALLMPSLTEGLPITLLEAVKYGKPVFAAPVGGIPNFFYGFENYFLLGRDRNLSMVGLIENWQKLEFDQQCEIIEKLQNKMNQEYSLASMVNGYLSVYRAVRNGGV